MGCYQTRTLSKEQFEQIIFTMKNGCSLFRPNIRIATILVTEANLGIRIGDVLNLRLDDIVLDGERYRLDIVEQKTGKKRKFTVPKEIHNYLQDYCLKNGIKPTEKIFDISERAVQKHLSKVCDYLGYEDISTHSFRKFFATEIYNNNNHDIVLVQQLLQHSSPATTENYIGISSKQIEDAILGHLNLM